MGDALKIVTLCTGNVARSVMLGYMLTTIGDTSGADWKIRTAGTHAIEGHAMSARTRNALITTDELGEHHYSAHRSHQLSAADVTWATVVLASEAAHVHFVRNSFPDAAAKVVQLHQFVARAPLDAPFDEQLATVTSAEPSSEFDVTDPAGGDQGAYDACAQQLWELLQIFAVLVNVDGFG